MHEFVSFDHQILPAEKTNIQSSSIAALYGKGVFTTIAIQDGKPFLWDKHWSRLTANAGKICLDPQEFQEQKVLDSLYRIVGKNCVGNGRCRLTFFDESAPKLWQAEMESRICLLIQTADRREVKNRISLTFSPFQINSTSPLVGVKSCNYLGNSLALDEAITNGFDEAIRTNEKGHVTSACMANIFWLKNDRLFTPGLQTGCLEGTTREFVLENWDVFEVEETLENLEDADALFLTSAGLGIVQAASLGETKFRGEPHPLTQLLRNSSPAT